MARRWSQTSRDGADILQFRQEGLFFAAPPDTQTLHRRIGDIFMGFLPLVIDEVLIEAGCFRGKNLATTWMA